MKLIVVFVAMMAAMPTIAQTPSAEDYYEGCNAVSENKKWLEVQPEHQAVALKCLGAVSVVLFDGRKNGICLPAPIPETEAAAIVARHLDQNPDKLKEPFRSVAREALADEFPCGT